MIMLAMSLASSPEGEWYAAHGVTVRSDAAVLPAKDRFFPFQHPHTTEMYLAHAARRKW